MPHRSRTILSGLVLVTVAGCGPTLIEAVTLMHDDASADHRRDGVAAVATDFPLPVARQYAGSFRRLAKSDPDPAVRAMAVRALNLCRDASATPIFVAGLTDAAEPVRLESAKALANVPDPNAVPGLLDLLAGTHQTVGEGGAVAASAVEPHDVRIAAAGALRHYPTQDVERALTSHLNDRDFGLAWQAHQSLILLTGHTAGYDPAAWGRLVGGS